LSTLQKNELTIRDQCTGDAANATEKKAVLGKERKGGRQDNKHTWKDHGKGVVYLSHIPEGFYEEEMYSYFSQFGRVTRLNVVKSKKVLTDYLFEARAIDY
jgi:RNA recognition motif-containing protein